MLPRTNCDGIAYENGFAVLQRADAIGHDAIRRVVTAADDIARTDCDDRASAGFGRKNERFHEATTSSAAPLLIE